MGKSTIYLHRLLERAFGYENRIVLERPQLVKDFRSAGNFDFKIGGYDDVMHLGKDLGYDDEGKSYARKRAKKGDVAALAFRGQDVIAYKWIMLNEFELPFGNALMISPDRYYMYKTFVTQQYRGMRLSAMLNSQLDIFLSNQHLEKKYCVTWIMNTNASSLRSASSVGHKVIGYIRVIEFLSLKRYYMSENLASILNCRHDQTVGKSRKFA